MKLPPAILRSRAFSLIEIMVAVSLLAIILVGLLAMFYETQRAFRSGATQSDVLEGGRATLQIVARELQELTASRVSQVVNLEAAAAQTTAMPLPDGTADRTNVLQDVIFLSREGDDWSATAYRIANANGGVGSLYRFTTNSPVRDNNVSNLVNIARSHAPGEIPELFHRVTDGVVHFRLLPFYSNGYPIGRTNSPLVAGVFPDIVVGGPNDALFLNQALPAYVELELGILEPRTLEQFRTRAFNPAVAAPYLAKQAGHIQLFRERIPIRNAP